VSKGFFITGTDTEIGKTTISLGLINVLQHAGHKVSAMKPVASGCVLQNGALRNDDALKLIAACNQELIYDQVNPYAFEPPIAPHIAAEQVGVIINISTICDLANTLQSESDYCIIEGAGGWLVPLNENNTIEDLAIALKLPVILVVGLRLGCINHATLTAKAIQNSGLVLAGWVANHCNKDIEQADKMIGSLKQRIDAPCIGVVDYLYKLDAEAVGSNMDISLLT